MLELFNGHFKRKSVKNAIIATIKEIVQTILISLAIFLFVYNFLVQPHRVKGDSMYPNFHDGELLLTEKISYRLYKPDRGDVIVFKAPGAQNVDYIKRIIAIPGDTVKINDGSVSVNTQKLKELYETQETSGNLEITLGKNQYFVLGDNRGASSDSRSFGSINGDSIRGRAWLVYWPLWKSANSGGLRVVSKVSYGVPDAFNN